MALPGVETVVVAEELKGLLDGVDGLRTYWYVSDTVRPVSGGGAVVIGQPTIDYQDGASGFCSAAWVFPLTLLVARSNDREAQTLMSRFLMEIAHALSVDVPGIFSLDLIDASPITVTLSGQELPAYQIRAQVRA